MKIFGYGSDDGNIFDAIGDMTDGGGPGNSGDSFSNVDNSALDTDGDNKITTEEAIAGGYGDGNLP